MCSPQINNPYDCYAVPCGGSQGHRQMVGQMIVDQQTRKPMPQAPSDTNRPKREELYQMPFKVEINDNSYCLFLCCDGYLQERAAVTAVYTS